MVGLITDNDETAYREEVRDLAVWSLPGQQPLPQRQQDKGDYRWTTGKRRAEHAPIEIDRCLVETDHITSGPTTVQTDQHSHEESTTTPLPPQEAEKIWHVPSGPQKVLQLTGS